MIKSFKKELRLIRGNKRFTEQLLTLSIYNEFYNDIMDTIDPRLSDLYSEVMEKTFELVVRSINSHKARFITAEKFMNLYFSAIRKNEFFNTPKTSQAIENIEKDLYKAEEILPFAPIIDQFEELTIDSKLDIMLEFREYIAKEWNEINATFGNYSPSLCGSILGILTNHLEKYLKHCKAENVTPRDIIEGVKPLVMSISKKFLLYKLDKNELPIPYLQDSLESEFFMSLNDLEKRIWLTEIVYAITGYKQELTESKKAKEICSFLGISRIRYSFTTMAMGLRSLNAISNSRSSDNSIKR